MRLVTTENVENLPLPPQHRFPIHKYRQIFGILADRHPACTVRAQPATTLELERVHDPLYVRAIESGTLERRAERAIGFPWTPELALRAKRSVGGSLRALELALEHGAAGHLAGGTHHAFADRGEGFCVFNDLAVVARHAIASGRVERVAIVDLDVHQGNGTAHIFQSEPRVFTLSLHGAKNFPFEKVPGDLDIPLADGTDDAEYDRRLCEALEVLEGFRPELVVYQAGVDPLSGDRYGRLALSRAGLDRRNARVYAFCQRHRAALVVTLGGGYHPDIGESVLAHVDVFERLATTFSG